MLCPSRIGHLLNMTIRDLERILYYESFVIIESGDTELEVKQMISEDKYAELIEAGSKFKALMGDVAGLEPQAALRLLLPGQERVARQ